ncbi:MAG: PGPGW domain-containing protein [Candidatus Babeliales bacterium]|jgi:uncharacterized protein YqgC (DUF456 family)
MNKFWKSIYNNGGRVVVGMTLLIIGIIGLFVPVIQGVLLILLGLALLGNKYAREKLRIMHYRLKRWLKR